MSRHIPQVAHDCLPALLISDLKFAQCSAQEGSFGNTITPISGVENVKQGDHVTLQCNYTGAVINLQWYRQYPGQALEYLLMSFEMGGGSKANEEEHRISAELDKDNNRSLITKRDNEELKEELTHFRTGREIDYISTEGDRHMTGQIPLYHTPITGQIPLYHTPITGQIPLYHTPVTT
ncbi:UNVERIFIED_CONTAM: hypothetical protein FKN15_017821 [Acipenser sinensis]